MPEELPVEPQNKNLQQSEGNQRSVTNPLDVQVPRQMDRPAPLQTASAQAYIERFAEIEEGTIDSLTAYPTIEEAIALAHLQNEVMVIRSQDQQIYIAKGKYQGNEIESPQVNMMGDVLTALHPVSVAHTHPTDASENPQRSLLGTVIPSAADLTSRKYGTATEYIFNEFGRTTFTPIENLGNLPQSHQQAGGETVMQQIVNSTMQAGIREARKQGITDVEKAINFTGEYMKIIGCQFKFERWDQVVNIEKPPVNFNTDKPINESAT
jgi:hypothetical protein